MNNDWPWKDEESDNEDGGMTKQDYLAFLGKVETDIAREKQVHVEPVDFIGQVEKEMMTAVMEEENEDGTKDFLVSDEGTKLSKWEPGQSKFDK